MSRLQDLQMAMRRAEALERDLVRMEATGCSMIGQLVIMEAQRQAKEAVQRLTAEAAEAQRKEGAGC